MILAASRRTDIPACYAPWFMQRLRQGHVLVRNPYNALCAARVPLHADVVDCIVFFSKNFSPLLAHLAELRALGHKAAFQYTLNAYGPPLEPRLPPLGQRVDVFRQLADWAGTPHALTWRYDPVILDKKHSLSWHVDTFGGLCRALQGAVHRCVFSFVDDYAHLPRSRVAALGTRDPAQQRLLAAHMAAVAAEHGLRLATCAEAAELGDLGIDHAACLDAAQLALVVGQELRVPPGTGQRPLCRCVRCVDVGAYNTCTQGCVYCYATSNAAAAYRHAREHRLDHAALGGTLPPEARIIEKEERSCKVSDGPRQGSLLD